MAVCFDSMQTRKEDSLYSFLQLSFQRTDLKKVQELIIACDHRDLFFPSSGAISTIKNELHLKQFVRTR
jgi:hypothetical protein